MHRRSVAAVARHSLLGATVLATLVLAPAATGVAATPAALALSSTNGQPDAGLPQRWSETVLSDGPRIPVIAECRFVSCDRLRLKVTLPQSLWKRRADVAEHLVEAQADVRPGLVDLALVAGGSRRHGVVEDLERRSEGDVLLRQRIRRSDGTFRDVASGNVIWHAIHGHYHFDGFAQSLLWAVDTHGDRTGAAPAGTGDKVSFCIATTSINPVHWGLRGFGTATHPAPDCLAPESTSGSSRGCPPAGPTSTTGSCPGSTSRSAASRMAITSSTRPSTRRAG